jgi:hypothetical protein
MTSVLLVGTGQVGVRVARQLVETSALERILITSHDPRRAAELAGALGPRAEAIAADDALGLSGVDSVAVATRPTHAHRWVRAATDAGVPTALANGDGFGWAPGPAPHAGIVTGCALAPGLTDVLVRHAAGLFDRVDEVHVARVGAAGPACVEAVREARRETPGEWRDGAWHTDRSFGPELLWFPEPVGSHECQLVRPGVNSAVAAVPGVRHATSRVGAPPAANRVRRRFARRPVDQGWGAVRVEVIGARAGASTSVIYGLVDRTDIVAAVVLAVTATALAGAADGLEPLDGIRTLGEVVRPVPFLTELARRGVKAAVFEGVVPH